MFMYNISLHYMYYLHMKTWCLFFDSVTLWTMAIILSCHITMHLILIFFQTIAQNCFHYLTFLILMNTMVECMFMWNRQKKREWMKNKSLKRKHCRVNSKYRNSPHRMKHSRKNCKLLCLFEDIMITQSFFKLYTVIL